MLLSQPTHFYVQLSKKLSNLVNLQSSLNNKEVFPFPSLSLESDRSCQSFRLGRGVPVPHGAGNMVTCGSQASHEHPGAQSRSDGSAIVDPPSLKTHIQGAVRQCHGCGLHQPSRAHQGSYSLEGSKSNNFMGGKSPSYNLCCPHSRRRQLESRLP